MSRNIKYSKKQKGMRRLSALTKPVIAHATENHGAIYTQICSLWPNISDEVSKWSYPKVLSFPKSSRHNGTLTIWVDPGRGPEAQARAQEIINNINMVCGFKAVGRIICQQTFELPKKMGGRKFELPQNTSQMLPRDANPMLLNLLEQKTNDISDPELRATLIRLGSVIALKNQHD